MSQLDDQRIVFESLDQLVEISALFAIIFKRPRKLHQHRAEFACFHKRIDPFAESLLIFLRRFAARVREGLVEFRSENEIRIVLDSRQPRASRDRRCWTIETAVDFGGVEILCDQCQRVELRTNTFRIDTAAPIGVRPAGGSDANVAESAHEHEVSTICVSGWINYSTKFTL